MGLWAATVQRVREVLSPVPSITTLDLPPAATFDTAPRPVDQVITAMRYGELGRVSRQQALSVAAVQRGRNELCSIATLPLRLYQGLNVVDAPLFRQYDPDVPNVVHLAATVEDLCFESIAWWQVTGQDFDGYPVSVRRVDPCDVTLKPPGGATSNQLVIPGVDQANRLDPQTGPTGKWVWIDRHDGRGPQPFPASLMIRFDSPNPGILQANARAVRIAMQLDRLTEMYASNPALREYFTDSDDPNVSPMAEDEIDAFLAEYGAMRSQRPYGWLPSSIKRADVASPSPKDLTLADLQQQVMVAIANGLGVDPEDIGVSTTSRTYQNEDARRRDKVNRMYAPYMSAITDRLVMGDVTRRGYTPRWDLTDYLKPDPLTQVEYWAKLEELGVTDAAEIRGWAGLSGPPPAAALDPAPAAVPAPKLHAVHGRFDGEHPVMTFAAGEFAAATAPATVDAESRTITGLALPYNAVARKYGIAYRFVPGSLEYGDPARVKHLQDHVTPVGSALSLDDAPEGLTARLSVLSGPEGSPARVARDQLLHDAAGGLYDGLSVGVDFSLDPEDGDVTYNEADGVYDVQRATLREISSTPMPAFDDARVTRVAASRTPGGDTVDPCTHCGGRHAPGIACATFAAQTRTAPPAPRAGAETPAGEPATFAALDAYLAARGATPPAVEAPTPVSPLRSGALEVHEAAPYRFDRYGNLRAGSHDFSSDLFAGWSPGGGGDQAARDRAEGFLRAAFANKDFGNALLPEAASSQFAITPANVVNLNYPQNRPDLYVDQLDYQYPLYAGSLKGSLDAVTPFVIPKFNSSSGLVADHVTGTEPTPGAFTATAQTITPSAVSGKVEITREAFDQGGNPQMSGLIWRQMVRGWYEALEAFVQAQLIANVASIPDLVVGVSTADAVLDAGLAAGLVPLQYIRGGDRYRVVYTQIDLFTAMVKAKDTTGRRLYPSLGAMNAVGTTDPGYNSIEAHGKLFVPAWATEATSASLTRSWMFDPDVVCLWASAPQRIDLAWRVAWVDLGIWGYKAFGITDFTRTREVQYTR